MRVVEGVDDIACGIRVEMICGAAPGDMAIGADEEKETGWEKDLGEAGTGHR